jgi:hypothetical protein
MHFINSEYCFFFFLLFIHYEAEYEHFTDNMFHSNTYIHLNINH